MKPINFGSLKSVLCLGAHPDDIEIGCGGTLLKMLDPERTRITWVVFSGDRKRGEEAIVSAANWFNGSANCCVEVMNYEDGFFPSQWDSIKRDFRGLAERVDPDLVFTHCLEDRHQDHRTLAELTWQTFRNHAILEYEIPKYEGDNVNPNFYVQISQTHLDKKVDGLLQHHKSQASKPWFDEDLFRSLARLRGTECASRYAEAFHARKLLA